MPQSQSLTNKSWSLEFFNGDTEEFTQSEAEIIESGLLSGTKFLKIKAGLVNVNSIKRLVPISKLKEYAHEKDGDWKCEYERWHKEGVSCRCGVVDTFDKENQVYVRTQLTPDEVKEKKEKYDF